MQTMLNLAMFAYPRDFRDDYREQIKYDMEIAQTPRQASRILGDVLLSGLAMRLDALWNDLRFAVRSLLKKPLFTTVILVTLALAIAGNAVIFSILDAVVLRPLPYVNPDRIGIVVQTFDQFTMGVLNVSALDALARGATTLDGVSTAAGETQPVQIGARVKSMTRTLVAPNLFDVLGVRPELGRFFSAAAARGQARDVVISDQLWREYFGASSDALGRQVLIGGTAYTVIGVMAPGFVNPTIGSTASDVWTLFSPAQRASSAVFPIVRVKNGVSWQAANADVTRVIKIFERARHLDGTAQVTQLRSINDIIVGDARRFLWILFAAMTGVLVIASANIANLLVGRGAERAPEFGLRASLGATDRRIGMQLLTEMLVLAAYGAVVGLVLAQFAVPLTTAAMPSQYARIESTHIDWIVVLYVMALTVGVTLFSGLVPIVWRKRATGTGASRVRFALVALEIAVTFALVVSSGLLLRSFVTMIDANVGFDKRGLYAAVFEPRTAGGVAAANVALDAQFPERLARRIAAIPGVTSAGASTSVPFSTTTESMVMGLGLEGKNAPAGSALAKVLVRFGSIAPGYIETMRVPLVRGRLLTPSDTLRHGVLVDETFAKLYFPNENPVGRELSFNKGPIVGIVGSVRNSLTADPAPHIYEGFSPGWSRGLPVFAIAIRTDRANGDLAAAVVAATKDLTPGYAPPTLTSVEEQVADNASRTRTSLWLLGSLAAIALLLALAGIYSVVTYATVRRFHEIGIRMALGARATSVVSRIMRGALAQSVVGIAAGVVIAALTTRLMTSELYQTSPLDPLAFAGTLAVIVACSLVAALVPAWRAAHVDPAVTLRYE